MESNITWMLVTVVLFKLYVITTICSECSDTGVRYEREAACTDKTGTDFILSTLNNVKQVDCAMECGQADQCMVFYYNPGTGTCTLHNRTLTDIGMNLDVGSVCFTDDDIVESWIVEVVSVSSNYVGKPSHRLIGPSDSIEWAQSNINQEDFLVVRITQEVYVQQIHIYERYWTGGVNAVSLQAPNGTWYTVWTTYQLENTHDDRILSPVLQATQFKTSRVRIDIGSRTEYEQIDAVRVTGRLRPPLDHFV